MWRLVVSRGYGIRGGLVKQRLLVLTLDRQRDKIRNVGVMRGSGRAGVVVEIYLTWSMGIAKVG